MVLPLSNTPAMSEIESSSLSSHAPILQGSQLSSSLPSSLQGSQLSSSQLNNTYPSVNTNLINAFKRECDQHKANILAWKINFNSWSKLLRTVKKYPELSLSLLKYCSSNQQNLWNGLYILSQKEQFQQWSRISNLTDFLDKEGTFSHLYDHIKLPKALWQISIKIVEFLQCKHHVEKTHVLIQKNKILSHKLTNTIHPLSKDETQKDQVDKLEQTLNMFDFDLGNERVHLIQKQKILEEKVFSVFLRIITIIGKRIPLLVHQRVSKAVLDYTLPIYEEIEAVYTSYQGKILISQVIDRISKDKGGISSFSSTPKQSNPLNQTIHQVLINTGFEYAEIHNKKVQSEFQKEQEQKLINEHQYFEEHLVKASLHIEQHIELVKNKGLSSEQIQENLLKSLHLSLNFVTSEISSDETMLRCLEDWNIAIEDSQVGSNFANHLARIYLKQQYTNAQLLEQAMSAIMISKLQVEKKISNYRLIEKISNLAIVILEIANTFLFIKWEAAKLVADLFLENIEGFPVNYLSLFKPSIHLSISHLVIKTLSRYALYCHKPHEYNWNAELIYLRKVWLELKSMPTFTFYAFAQPLVKFFEKIEQLVRKSKNNELFMQQMSKILENKVSVAIEKYNANDNEIEQHHLQLNLADTKAHLFPKSNLSQSPIQNDLVKNLVITLNESNFDLFPEHVQTFFKTYLKLKLDKTAKAQFIKETQADQTDAANLYGYKTITDFLSLNDDKVYKYCEMIQLTAKSA